MEIADHPASCVLATNETVFFFVHLPQPCATGATPTERLNPLAASLNHTTLKAAARKQTQLPIRKVEHRDNWLPAANREQTISQRLQVLCFVSQHTRNPWAVWNTLAQNSWLILA